MSSTRAADDRLVALAESGRRLSETTSLDRLYSLAAELALDVLGASSASLSRLEHERGILRVLRNTGRLAPWEEPAPDDETYDIMDFPLLGETAERARAWVGQLGDSGTGEAHRQLLMRMGMSSSISIPVVVHGRLWGEIGAARDASLPPFGETDIAAGEAYSGLLSAALGRIAERDELLNLAYRDALTGLGNRRAADDHLEELLGTNTGEGGIAVVLCDVNGLKRVNDTYGHDAGDRLLREVGSLLTRMASTVPRCFAARLGGDEFCLLIGGITEIDLQRLTERLSEEATTLPMGASLSCGWARTSLRDETATPGEAARALLRLADAAQYRAKRTGRDVQAGGSLADLAAKDPATVGTRIAAAVIARLADTERIEDRLAAVAEAFAEVVDASSWCVSVSVDSGPVVIVRNAEARQIIGRDATAFRPGAAFDLDDYPATSAALRGGTFHATLEVGHDTEREFLASHGYDEIVGAGTPVDGRHAWLVEILGDAMSLPLRAHQGLLQSLVALAASGQDDEATSPRWAGLDDRDSTAC